MKGQIQQIFKNNTFIFLIGGLLTLSLMWPLFAAPYFSHHDDVQIIRMYEMWKCFKDGQLPCRWVPDLGGGFGYPIFNYYAPLAYYVGGFIFFVTGNLTFSAKAMFGISFLGAYIFMFLLGRKVWGSFGGLISALSYSFIPYHSLVFYVRGAMGEMWALMFYPACLWALLRLKEKPNLINSIVFALNLSLLILSHNLSTMIFIPSLIVFFLIALRQGVSGKFVKGISFAAVLVLLLCAFYLLPMVMEKGLVHVDTTTYGYFSYTEHFKGLRKLFLDFSWGWGDSVREVPGGAKDGLSFQIGIFHWIGFLIGSAGAIKLFRKERSKALLIIAASVVVLISVFMIHPRSEPVWKLVTPLKYMQFPWRFLGLISFYLSFVLGAGTYIFKTIKFGKYLLLIFLLLFCVYNFQFFRPKNLLYLSDSEFLSGDRWNAQIRRAIFDYLPIFAEAPPPGVADGPYQILTGDTQVLQYRAGTNWITMEVDTSKHSILRLSQYYFPDWRIKIDGNDARIDYENSLGLMTVILGQGRHSIEAKLEETPVRTLGNLLSLVGIICLVVSLIIATPVTKKRMLYYLNSFYR